MHTISQQNFNPELESDPVVNFEVVQVSQDRPNTINRSQSND
jgi:hypothetical protein